MAKQTTQVYEDLKKRIIKGEYSPSESLPEQELSNQYGVSRNTIKKALLMLEKENLVTIELNKGAKVRSYSLSEVLEFLELRSCLEGFIIRLAVPAFTDELLHKLEQTLELMRQYYETHQLLLYSQKNQIFHQIIYDACPNRTAVNMTINLKTQMSKYNIKTILIPGRDEQSFSEHTAIYEAIKCKNSELAQDLMTRHILNIRKIFDEYFSLLF